jgi:hypothetical protein
MAAGDYDRHFAGPRFFGKNAEIKTWNDNITIFDAIAKGDADLMLTDASE